MRGVSVPSRSVVIQERPNPTTDYFVRPWLQREGAAVDFRSFDGPPEASAAGERLVFVRYVSAGWRAWVERERRQGRLGELVFFADDDLFDWRATAGLPWRYRLKLWRLATRHVAWLRRMGATLWVSSEYLARRYGPWFPAVRVLPAVSPYPGAAMASPDASSRLMFYHGSASHLAEHRWLRPVVEAVLSSVPDARFEVIGDARVQRLYRGLARTRVVPPMGWPEYQGFVTAPGRAVGLAPLLPSRFNAARAPTKRWDITAAGAVGIYADDPVYRATIEDGVNGRLCPMDRAAWVAALTGSLEAPAQRQRLWEAAAA